MGEVMPDDIAEAMAKGVMNVPTRTILNGRHRPDVLPQLPPPPPTNTDTK